MGRRGWRVAVLAGGTSPESEVSLASGARVTAALTEAGHRPEMIDPREADLDRISWGRFERCVLALHGGAGEDGRIQRQLEQRRIAYTGSRPAASQAAMRKSQAKAQFTRHGVPTPDWVRLGPDDNPRTLATQVARLGFPVVVKPDAAGSSLGVGLARNAAELPDRVEESRRYDATVLIERWIEGREFTVGILGRRPLPLLEIASGREIFDYHAKYTDGSAQYHFEPALPPILLERLRHVALGAVEALGTSGIVRVDLMLDRAGRPWVLEVNTSPGMTETSLVPLAAARAGIDMPELCDWMLRAG